MLHNVLCQLYIYVKEAMLREVIFQVLQIVVSVIKVHVDLLVTSTEESLVICIKAFYLSRHVQRLSLFNMNTEFISRWHCL